MNIKNKKTQIILVGAMLALIAVSAAYFSRGVLFQGETTGGLGGPVAPIGPDGNFGKTVTPAMPEGVLIPPPTKPNVSCTVSPNPVIKGETVTWAANAADTKANPEDLSFRWELLFTAGEFYGNIEDKYPNTGAYLSGNKSIEVKYPSGAKSATAKPFLLIKRAWAALDEYIVGTPCTVTFIDKPTVLEAPVTTDIISTLKPAGETSSIIEATALRSTLESGSFSVTPTEIYPLGGRGRSTRSNISFKLIENTKGWLRVFRGTTLVKKIIDGESLLKSVSYAYFWEGENDSGSTVTPGAYTIRLELLPDKTGYFSDTVEQDVTVVVPAPAVTTPSPETSKAPATGATAPTREVSEPVDEPASFEVYPRTITPGNNSNNVAKISFSLNKDRQVSLKILDQRGNALKTIVNNSFRARMTHGFSWVGDDDKGNILADGLYTVKIEIISGERRNYVATANIYVKNPAPISPPELSPATPVSNNLTTQSTVPVQTTTPVQPATPVQPVQPPLPSTSPTSINYFPVVLQPYGNIVASQPPSVKEGSTASKLCAGFTDVLRTNALCPAIEYVKEKGVFSGYPDGTFRPYTVIKRAEAVKVILLAFKKTILTDIGRRVYRDTEAGKWYSPFLLTAKLLGITGYPDGTFRPDQQVNKVELLKMFFNVAGRDLSDLQTVEKPYPDVPVDNNTMWYLKYVEFTKKYALLDVSKEGLFYPGAGIQRGDVAELFHRYHLAELDK